MSAAISSLAALVLITTPYVDTKGRFDLELPAGWRLLPAYGDTFGMRFQRELAGGRISLTVHVDPVDTPDLEAFVTEIEGWVIEQGLERRSRTKGRVGRLDAIVLEFGSAKKSKERGATKARSYFIEDHGHRFHLHASASPPHVFERASRELSALLGSFTTRAAKSGTEPPGQPPVAAQASIVGAWESDKGVRFQLMADGRFIMGKAEGRYLQRGETLALMIEGKSPQTFRVELARERLLLHSERLPEPAAYRRAAIVVADTASAALVGHWRATIPGGTLELHLESSGRFDLESHRGRWVHEDGLLSLTTDAGEVITYAVEVAAEKLGLSGGDLEEPLWLQKISGE